jgi:predicted pyridoxine 5'-phosphate oxidase superfamily flavin-nucleotide-binding protein
MTLWVQFGCNLHLFCTQPPHFQGKRLRAISLSFRARREHHFRVTGTYTDNEISGRVYNNREKAEKFAGQQKRSPFVKSTKVEQID